MLGAVFGVGVGSPTPELSPTGAAALSATLYRMLVPMSRPVLERLSAGGGAGVNAGLGSPVLESGAVVDAGVYYVDAGGCTERLYRTNCKRCQRDCTERPCRSNCKLCQSNAQQASTDEVERTLKRLPKEPKRSPKTTGRSLDGPDA